MIASQQESYDEPRQCVEKQRYYSADKGQYSQGYGLPSGHVEVWELDHKEGRTSKNWCLQTVVLEKTPKSALDSKEIKPVNLKGNQPWILIGKTDVETPVFWSSDANSWSLEKSWCWERLSAEGKKRSSEDKMDGYHHWCNRHQLGQTSGDGEGQGGLVCCSPCGCKESDLTVWLSHSVYLEEVFEDWYQETSQRRSGLAWKTV